MGGFLDLRNFKKFNVKPAGGSLFSEGHRKLDMV